MDALRVCGNKEVSPTVMDGDAVHRLVFLFSLWDSFAARGLVSLCSAKKYEIQQKILTRLEITCLLLFRSNLESSSKRLRFSLLGIGLWKAGSLWCLAGCRW